MARDTLRIRRCSSIVFGECHDLHHFQAYKGKFWPQCNVIFFFRSCRWWFSTIKYSKHKKETLRKTKQWYFYSSSIHQTLFSLLDLLQTIESHCDLVRWLCRHRHCKWSQRLYLSRPGQTLKPCKTTRSARLISQETGYKWSFNTRLRLIWLLTSINFSWKFTLSNAFFYRS